MKPVTVYEAEDGSRWDEPSEAMTRDRLIEECEAECEHIGLKDRPEGIEFMNGGGYIQQPDGARDRLFGFLKSKGVSHYIHKGPLGGLLHRFHCIDDQDREWGQPYFALHSEEGEDVEVSP